MSMIGDFFKPVYNSSYHQGVTEGKMRDGALPEDRKTLGFGSNHITKIRVHFDVWTRLNRLVY